MADAIAKLWLLSESNEPSTQNMGADATSTRGLTELSLVDEAPERPLAPPPLPPLPPAKPVAKILFLDGLRGLAAMMVVCNHAGYFHDHNVGAPAVDTFFVLSAFLLTLLFEKKARQLVSQNASLYRWRLALGDYFARRFLRVYPLFALVATVLAVLPGKERTRSLKMAHPEKYHLLKVLLFFPDSHPHILWSLPVEISYYFLIPVFVVVSVRLGKRWWLLAVAGVVVVFVNGVCLWQYRRQHGRKLAHYPTLLCGSLGAMIFARMDDAITRSPSFTWTPTRVYALRAIELFFGVLLLSNLFDGLLFHYIAKNPLPDTNHFISFPVTALIVCEMLRPGPLSSVLEWSLLRFAGKVSFSMYLLHIFVVDADFLTRATFYDRFFLLWTLVFLLSTASYHAVELPCQQAAARIGKWVKQKDASAAAAADTVPRMVQKATGEEIDLEHAAKSF